ncbi:hypothetical protein GGI22_006883, partial [Coemansia erecta]
MDNFAASVTNRTFQLHPVDTQAAFLNIPYHFFHPNSHGNDEFMPSGKLRDSFYRALVHFPILAGNVGTDKHGQTCINVDRNNLNMPEYVESTSDVHFDTMRESKFHWTSWPNGLTTVGAITRANAEGIIKLLNVHIVRMKDNSGIVIFVNMPHYAGDGTCLFAFVELWGKMCKDPTESGLELAVTFDRDIIAKSLASAEVEKKPLNKEMVRVYTGFNPIADLLAWLSPGIRAWILDKARMGSDVASASFR